MRNLKGIPIQLDMNTFSSLKKIIMLKRDDKEKRTYIQSQSYTGQSICPGRYVISHAMICQ